MNHDSVDNDTKTPSLTRLQEVQGQLVSIIKWRGLKPKADRYAALLSQCRSQAARDLTLQVFEELRDWQRETRKRLRGY
jgi:hypothetical protein